MDGPRQTNRRPKAYKHLLQAVLKRKIDWFGVYKKTTVFGTARFPSVRVKASSNAFPIYRFPSRSLPPLGFGIVQETLQRYEIFRNFIALSKKRIKITFHQACETTFGAKNSRNISKNLEVKSNMSIFALPESTTLPFRTAYQGGTFYL